jgi:hypothetical protein
MGAVRAGTHGRQCHLEHPRFDQLNWEKIMLSDFEVLRAADQMMHEFGEHAELQAAKYADLMLGHSNRAALMVWARIWRTIAEKRPAQTGLPH